MYSTVFDALEIPPSPHLHSDIILRLMFSRFFSMKTIIRCLKSLLKLVSGPQIKKALETMKM